MATGLNPPRTATGLQPRNSNMPSHWGGGISVSGNSGPQAPDASGNYPSQSPWTPFFGVSPHAQGPEPYERENYDLPDVFGPAGIQISQVMIRTITAEDQFWVREVLPWKFNESNDQIRYNVLKFNDHLLNRRPAESVSRLLTSEKTEGTRSYNYYGIAMIMESGFSKTREGVEYYKQSLKQIANATVETACLGVARELTESEGYIDTNQQAFGIGLTHTEFMRVVNNEISQFGAINHEVGGLKLLLDQAKEVLQTRGVTPNLTIVPFGAMKYLQELSPEINNRAVTGKEPVASVSLTGYGTIRESRKFVQGERQPNVDLFYRPRTIGNHFFMDFQETRNVPPEHYRTEMRDIFQWSEDSMDWERQSLTYVFDHSGIYVDSDSKILSDMGTRILGADNYLQYMNEHNCADEVVNSIISTPKKRSAFARFLRNHGVRSVGAAPMAPAAGGGGSGVTPFSPQALLEFVDIMVKITQNISAGDFKQVLDDLKTSKSQTFAAESKAIDTKTLITLLEIAEKGNSPSSASAIGAAVSAAYGGAPSPNNQAIVPAAGGAGVQFVVKTVVSDNSLADARTDGLLDQKSKATPSASKNYGTPFALLGDAITEYASNPPNKSFLEFLNNDYLSDGYSGVEAKTNQEAFQKFFKTLEDLPSVFGTTTIGGFFAVGAESFTGSKYEVISKAGPVGARVAVSPYVDHLLSEKKLTRQQVSSSFKRLAPWLVLNPACYEEFGDLMNRTLLLHVIAAPGADPTSQRVYAFRYWATAVATAYSMLCQELVAASAAARSSGAGSGTGRRGKRRADSSGSSEVSEASMHAFSDESAIRLRYLFEGPDIDDETRAARGHTAVKGRFARFADFLKASAYATVPEVVSPLVGSPLMTAASYFDFQVAGASAEGQSGLLGLHCFWGPLRKSFPDATSTSDGKIFDPQADTPKPSGQRINELIIRSNAIEGLLTMVGERREIHQRYWTSIKEKKLQDKNNNAIAGRARTMMGEYDFDVQQRGGVDSPDSKRITSFISENWALDADLGVAYDQVCSALRQLHCEDARFLLWCLENDVKFCLSFLLLVPHMRYTCGTMAMLQAGSNLGNTYYGFPDFQVGRNTHQKMIYGHFTIKFAAVILNPIYFHRMRDVYVRSYDGGGGHTFYEYDHDCIRSYSQGDLEGYSVFAVAVPPDYKPKTHVMDITGMFDPSIYASADSLHYPTATIYASVWGWRHGVDVHDGTYASHEEPKYNTITVSGCQVNFRHTGNGNGDWNVFKVNKGHLGERITPGCTKVRNGQQLYLEPANYTHKASLAVIA